MNILDHSHRKYQKVQSLVKIRTMFSKLSMHIFAKQSLPSLVLSIQAQRTYKTNTKKTHLSNYSQKMYSQLSLNYYTTLSQIKLIVMIQIFVSEVAHSPEAEHDYDGNPQIQPSPSIWNKFFFFNRLHMLRTYISGIKKETLFRYNDNFKPNLTSTIILQKYFKRKEQKKQFNIASQIFKMEKIAFISLFILSIVTGGISVVPIYFQSVLIKAVIGTSGDYYSIYVVVCVILLRFFIMNYVLNLSSNIAINVKLHLQNTFMRSIFYLQEDHYAILKGRIKYLDLDIITQVIYYIPYLITSLILIFGAIFLTFIYMSPYTLIVITIYIIIIFLIIQLGRLTFKNMVLSRRRAAERERYARKSMENLMNVAFQRMSDYLYQLLVVQKSMQTKGNIKINLQYILGQTLGELCIVLSVITFFALSHNGIVPAENAYYAILFLTTTISPMRYCVYGFFLTLKAYQAFRQIQAKLESISQISIHDIHFNNEKGYTHKFAQNIGDCFEYSYEKQNQQQKQLSLKLIQELQLRNIHSSKSIQFELKQNRIRSQKRKTFKLPSIQEISEHNSKGRIVMMFCKIDSNVTPQDYYLELIKKKPLGSTATTITSDRFILPDTLRNNICFYSDFDAVKYRRVIQLTQLTWLQQQLESKAQLEKDEHIRFSEWQETRIQLARALYNNVDFLLINKPLLLEDEQLIKRIIEQRKCNNKITIIVNNYYLGYYRYADLALIVDRTHFQLEAVSSLLKQQKNILKQIFYSQNDKRLILPKNVKFIHKDLFAGIKLTAKPEEQQVREIKKATILQLFRLVQGQAEFLIILTLILPPSCKFYMQYLIGQSLNQSMLFKYLFFGIMYIILNFLRGLTLTLYTNFGSLALYQQICRKNRRLNAHQIIEHSQKPAVDWDYHQKVIDKNLVMDFEYGQSIALETMISFIILCTGQPLYIAVAVPMIVINMYVTSLFARNARKMYVLKLKQTTGVHKVLATAVEHGQRIARYQKTFEFNEIFHKNNKVQTIFDLSIEWLQTGVRTIAQFILFLFFVTFLVIMVLTVKEQTTYTSLVSLGISLFINLMYINTFSMKAFRQMQISLYSLTICFNLLRSPPNPTMRQVYREQNYFLIKRISHIHSIQYRNISLKYLKNVYQKINLKIREGDRIVLSGDSNSFKETVFYLLKNKIFDKDEFYGNLVINGQVQEQFIIEGLFYLLINPLLPFFGTVYEVLKLSDPSITIQTLKESLLQFFDIVNTQPLFQPQTSVEQLSLGRKQLFELFKAIKVQKCKILVIVNGLDHIDIVTRRIIANYLINRSDINIVIETTNIQDIVSLYPRKLIFKDLKIEEVGNQ